MLRLPSVAEAQSTLGLELGDLAQTAEIALTAVESGCEVIA
jgi:hypothetical protein